MNRRSLEQQLGLVEGVTPGLADIVARSMADTGASQSRVLTLLKQDYGVR